MASRLPFSGQIVQEPEHVAGPLFGNSNRIGQHYPYRCMIDQRKPAETTVRRGWTSNNLSVTN